MSPRNFISSIRMTPDEDKLWTSIDVACNSSARASQIPGCMFKFMNSNDEDEIQRVGSLIAETFLQREPLMQHLNTSNPDTARKMHHLCQQLSTTAAAMGLTAIAKTVDGSVIAAILMAPWGSDITWPDIPAEIRPFWDLSEVLDNNFATYQGTSQSTKGQKVVELVMGAIQSNFEGRGIISDLAWIALLNAYQRGYDEAVAKSTSKSRTSLQKFGFATLAELAYTDYEYCGTKPFVAVENPHTALLMRAELKTVLQAYPSPLARLYPATIARVAWKAYKLKREGKQRVVMYLMALSFSIFMLCLITVLNVIF